MADDRGKRQKPNDKPTPHEIEYPYLVKTIITYTRTNAGGTEEKHKDADIVFELDTAGGKMPWYVLRNYLVPRYLIDKYGPKEVGWQRIYEIKIIKQINRNNPDDITGIPLRIMTYEQLDLYCRRWQLNVPVHDFYSVEKAREMVKLRLEDEKAYQKHYNDYKEGKQRNYPELDPIRKQSKAPTVPSATFDKIDREPKRGGSISGTNKKDPFQDV